MSELISMFPEFAGAIMEHLCFHEMEEDGVREDCRRIVAELKRQAEL